MTLVQKMAEFVCKASYEALSQSAREQLKIRVLDSLGCALGALEAEPVKLIESHTQDFGGTEHCTTFSGGRTAPDRAAFLNEGMNCLRWGA